MKVIDEYSTRHGPKTKKCKKTPRVKKKCKKRSNPILVFIMLILVTCSMVVLSVIITYYVMGFKACRIEGESMSPTIADDSIVIINPSKEIQRFDIVVFRGDNHTESLVVKRVIGLPGDDVTVIDGHLFVNGEGYTELYVDIDNKIEFEKESFKVIVPDDRYFVLGDNRDHSLDSRETGELSKEQIKGVMILKIKDGGE